MKIEIKQKKKDEVSQKYIRTIPVVLIILFGVAPVAANILEALPVGSPLPAALAPTVVTAKLPGGGFFTGTTTLLQEKITKKNTMLILILSKKTQVDV